MCATVNKTYDEALFAHLRRHGMSPQFHASTNDQTLKVAVNISANNLQDPDFTDHIKTLLVQKKVAAQWLELEVTESTATTNVATGTITITGTNLGSASVTIAGNAVTPTSDTATMLLLVSSTPSAPSATTSSRTSATPSRGLNSSGSRGRVKAMRT